MNAIIVPKSIDNAHKEMIWKVSWHPNGYILASCSNDKTVKLWNTKTMELMQILDDCHIKSIRCVCFSPDGMYLATAGFDSLVCLWIINDGQYKLIQKLEGHDNEVKCVTFSNDSKYLASCSKDASVWIWEKDDDLEFSCNCVLQAHEQDVKCLKWIPENILYSGSYDDSVYKYWQEDDEWEEKKIIQEQSTIWNIDYYNQLLLLSLADGTAKLYSNQYKIIQTFTTHNEPIYSGSFSHNGIFIALGSGDNKVSIYKQTINEFGQNQYTMNQIITPFDCDVNCVSFNNSMILAICGDDPSIKFIELQI